MAATTCILNSEHENQQQHPNHDAFDLGLYFQGWWSQDMGLQTDEKLSATNEFAAAKVDTARAEARAMFILFRHTQDGIKVSDDQILGLTEFRHACRYAMTAMRRVVWDNFLP